MDNISERKNRYEAIESFYQEIERLKNRLVANRKYLNDSSPKDVLIVWESSERLILESYHKTITADGSFDKTYTYRALLNEMRGQISLILGNGDALFSKPTEVAVNLWIEHLEGLLLNIPKMLKEKEEMNEINQ
jgi:hypothetical protein